jgi:hypothetical protein
MTRSRRERLPSRIAVAWAAFYYELVRRRYPGTDVAERARGRLAEMGK